MRTKTERVLRLMYLLSWLIFVGLSIETGGIITSFIVSLYHPEAAKNMYIKLNLFDLQQYDAAYYNATVAFIITISALKAFIAYLMIKIFSKINLTQPFSIEVAEWIQKISEVALGAGLLSIVANGYVDWLADKKISVPYHWAAEEFLLLGGVVFIVAQVFKKGIEMQSENELTI
ncbi:MAG: DUF2975 domain-containing protein [Bacteroidetes bacterium]|nr:DUF2975 domain-containing protein [Bacteroidota bacterium]